VNAPRRQHHGALWTGEGTEAVQHLQADLFQRAVALHRTGNLPQAEMLYRQLLAAAPNHADGLHLLGLLASQAGQPAAGLPLIDRAIRLRPRDGAYHDSRGQALKALGRLPDAIAAYRKAVRLQPEAFGSQYNLGNALYAEEAFDEAAKCYRCAIQLDPNAVGAYNNLGNACRALGQSEEAAAAFRVAVRLRPDTPELLFNLGRVLIDCDALAEAGAMLGEVVRLQPDHGPAHELLGSVRLRLGDWEAAAAAYEAAVRLSPDDPALAGSLATALVKLNRFDAVEAVFRAVLRRLPESADTWTGLGAVLNDVGRPDEAIACCDEALRLEPNHAGARYYLSIVDLTAGRLTEGWEGYETRWRAQQVKLPFVDPFWDGTPAPGQVLTVHEEQGLGDYIQFCRLVPLAAERIDVKLRVPRALRRLLGTLDGPQELVVAEEEGAPSLPGLHCPLLSLARALGITLETLPTGPYLSAEAGLVSGWRERLSELPGLRVGLAWAGNPDYATDLHRSLPGDVLRALVGTAGVSFISLQKGGAPWTKVSPELRAALGLVDWTDELGDFAETAALIAALDLVITVDTAIAHLAGAIGQPVWLLNRANTDWRWMRDRADSPWYPSMRIFRQAALGDWAGVLAQVRAALDGVERRAAPDASEALSLTLQE
jgi:tetratricopeptide (TPR) repeat protein